MRRKFISVFIILVCVSVHFTANETDEITRGRELYESGNYDEALKVLSRYSQSIEGVSGQEKNFAEANLLLAKIYFEAGEDGKVEEFLQKALRADWNVGSAETSKAFKKRIDGLRSGMQDTILKPGAVKKITVNGIVFEMVWVPPGEFLMGSPEYESGREKNEGPQHKVTISKGFWLGKYEVTQRQWQAIMGSNPSQFVNAGPEAPVEKVSWDETQEFIGKLNSQGDGRFRLPTEAEWEYACRAKSTGARYGELERIAWYLQNSGVHYDGGFEVSKIIESMENQLKQKTINDSQKQIFNGILNEVKRTSLKYNKLGTHAVGTLEPNAWGLHDMLGNVSEWCQDWYGEYAGNAQVDPTGPNSGTYRVVRGSSLNFNAGFVRAALRQRHVPGTRIINLGFRLALSSAGG